MKRGRVIRSRGTERGKGKENEREDGESCEDEGEKGEGCVRVCVYVCVWQQLDLILVVSDILTCKSTPLCASTLGHGLAALPCSKSTDGTISYN